MATVEEGLFEKSPMGFPTEGPWTGAQDVLTVKRVYGEPFEKDGVTIIPVAAVRGGGGGGVGGEPGSGQGVGGGFGASARPVGAFVIKRGEATWQPAVDVSRIVLGAQVVAVVAVLALRTVLKARSKARRRGR